MINQAKTITVGIPVYNESLNIANILNSILKQNLGGLVLNEILIISDGSTDTTVAIANSLNSNKIKIIDHKDRKGKSARTNEFFASVKTDILILVDGDVVLGNRNSLIELVRPMLSSANVGLTAGNPVQTQPQTFFETVMQVSAFLQQYLKINLRNGNNVYACHGRLLAFSLALIKKLRLPENLNITGDDTYIYFLTKNLGFNFSFVPQASVYFRMPQNFNDFKKQRDRFSLGREGLYGYFGKEIESQFYIPLIIKVKALFLCLFKYHIYAIVYFLILTIASISRSRFKGWEVSSSTKKI